MTVLKFQKKPQKQNNQTETQLLNVKLRILAEQYSTICMLDRDVTNENLLRGFTFKIKSPISNDEFEFTIKKVAK